MNSRFRLPFALVAACFLSQVAVAQQPPAGTKVLKDQAYVPTGHERQKLDLYVPKDAKNMPLIVWIHGGGWLDGSKDRCPALPFLDHGFAVASINYRLSSHAVFPAQIQDCKAAIRWLRANAAAHGIDANRIGVWGASAGGHLVALLGTTGDVKEFDVGPNLETSSRIQAVCDFFGPTDFTKMNAQATIKGPINHDAPDSPEAKLIGGAVQDNKDKCDKASPLSYVTEDDPPFFIVHGDQDPLVPLAQSALLERALSKADVACRLSILPGAGHGGVQFNTNDLEEQIRDFFTKSFKKIKALPAVAATSAKEAPTVPGIDPSSPVPAKPAADPVRPGRGVLLYSRYYNAKGETRYLPDGSFKDVLEKLRGEFEVRINSDPMTGETLKGVDVLLIANPSDKAVGENPPPPHVTAQDVKVLTTFVRDGGGLILMGNQENHNMEINDVNKLLEQFGLQYRERYTDAKLINLSSFNPVIGGLRWAFYTGNLVVMAAGHAARPRPLVLNDTSITPLGGSRNERGALMAAAELGIGRVVVVTDAGWISNDALSGKGIGPVSIKEHDNWEIMRRISLWSCHRLPAN